jgi:putative NADH-flavin reductase
MNLQKIALFGTVGDSTQRFATEALRRGHNVTVIVPNEKEFTLKHPKLKVVSGDVRNNYDVSKLAQGHDVVICTHEPTQSKPREHVEITRSVIEGVKDAGIHHLISVAHPFGQPKERTEEAYNEFKPIVKAQQEALKLFQNENQLQWGYAHSIEPEVEEKTGKYRSSNEILFTSQEGQSKIPLEGYASAIIDEAEKSEMELHGFGGEEGKED